MINQTNTIRVSKTNELTLTAILFAVALILSLVEMMLPPMPMMVPGMKLGLSNIVVMYALFFVGRSSALSIILLKSAFVLLMRGAFAGFLSFCGGVISMLIMVILISIFKDKVSYLLLSIFGAIFHNMGQLLAISFMITNLYLWVYLPVLILAGIIAGFATATLLKVVLPTLQKLGLR